ncbi:hypothetical protein ARTSIC4J27_2192 [Pseudarthrobacter siccitolerans]|uniref:Restriction endonuclease type IV Mrr domain-containing protein n=1 Tax=Pseudarthrobacter siccitolerans TaxID=861266 RepID=A0A024H2W2_9MICC|nr:hypothetical protein [Pseudarthrobacter siccitolerans]CCQ46232.1 hypothetical protein ARTSIC4J27_2192 [Pseudarthrobacter siccitolerans]
MPTYDWPLIQQRSGDSIESLIATLLRREHDDARQINPSQGDGGIDILRSMAGGIEIWQIKGFTTSISSNQFRQVKKSWNRFLEEHVTPGEKRIVRYHLVTPWTPTEERVTEFDELTADSGFPCQWDGDAFIAGLADRFPETMQRFTYGEGVLEQFISQKAMLASSPVERGESLKMLDAIETRQDALDALRDTIHDNYRIEHGTRTGANSKEIPLPLDGDPAVFHRMTYLGDSRWKYESVVPRTPDAAEIDPISMDVEFLVKPGTPEHDAVREWEEWGTPFQDVRVRTTTTGGPFAHEEPVESTFSIVEGSGVDRPFIYLRCTESNGQRRFRKPLVVTSQTVGSQTGWLRLVLDTPERSLTFELRFKQGESAEAKVQMGNVEGRNPESVCDELEELLGICESDVVSVETDAGNALLGAHGAVLPSALEALYLPVARHLTLLQAHTAPALVMPSIAEITDGQFRHLSLLATIYGGDPHCWRWTELKFQVPEDDTEAAFIRTVVIDAIAGRGTMVQVETPVFPLGNRTYTIDHPLASTTHSVQLESGVDPATLLPGDTFRLVPGTDDTVTTAKVADWTPGSIQFN